MPPAVFSSRSVLSVYKSRKLRFARCLPASWVSSKSQKSRFARCLPASWVSSKSQNFRASRDAFPLLGFPLNLEKFPRFARCLPRLGFPRVSSIFQIRVPPTTSDADTEISCGCPYEGMVNYNLAVQKQNRGKPSPCGCYPNFVQISYLTRSPRPLCDFTNFH